MSLDVFGQRFDAAGARVGGEFLVNEYTIGTQDHPSVSVDASGGFVVAWTSPRDGAFNDIFARRFQGFGSPATPTPTRDSHQHLDGNADGDAHQHRDSESDRRPRLRPRRRRRRRP